MSSISRSSTTFERGSFLGLFWGLIALAVFLGPTLAALAWVPEFITQDGPAHLYNAQILNASLESESRLMKTFEVRWTPVPNWAGHLGAMALLRVFRPDIASRILTGMTFVGLAAGVVWLRWVVAGSKGLVTTALLAVILGLNVTWLLGFTSFLIGAALMPITLGVWWGGREWFGPIRAIGVSALLVLGYFSHPVSLGLTIAGLGILAVCTPGVAKLSRAAWTLATLAPLVPLGLSYASLTRSGGGLEPVWQFLVRPWSVNSWINQLGWVDPLSLASRSCLPLMAGSSSWYWALSPTLWAVVALVLLIGSSWNSQASDRRGWLILGSLLVAAGIFGPDTLGVNHGHYLPQRVVLLGLVALVPWFDFPGGKRANRVAFGLLAGAWLIQSAFVWDYALDCRRVVSEVVRAGPAIGEHQRVGTLMVGIKRRFRANPLLHMDCLVGMKSENVVWNNYETSHYYFPVKVRSGLDHPSAPDFEGIALLDAPDEVEERVRRWELVLEKYAGSIDVIVVWSEQAIPRLEAINRSQGFEETYRDGSVRVWTNVGRIAKLPRGTP